VSVCPPHLRCRLLSNTTSIYRAALFATSWRSFFSPRPRACYRRHRVSPWPHRTLRTEIHKTLECSPEPSAACFSGQYPQNISSYGWVDTSDARLGQPNELYIVSYPDELCVIANFYFSPISPTLGKHWFHTNHQTQAFEEALAFCTCFTPSSSLYANRMETSYRRREAATPHQEVSCLRCEVQ